MTSPIFSSLRGKQSRRVKVMLWISRVLALAVIAMYFFAWWNESLARQDPQLGAIVNGDFFYQWSIWTHFLPALGIAIVIILCWRKPLLAGIGFALFALLQSFSVGSELAYIPIVVAPGVIVALSFAMTYRWSIKDMTNKDNT
jgi:hypothetical protein